MKINAIKKSIPRGWIVKKMDDFIKEGTITLGRGEVISKTDINNYPGENPIYSSSVKNNALFGTYAKYMFDEELITWSVDGGGDFFHRPKHKFSVTNVSGYMNVDQKQFDYKFLSYYLQEEHSKKSFDYQNKAHPSVIRGLYEIAKPPIKEQQKIAEILGTVDEDIAKTQDVIDATEKLKRGLMQQLFTRGIGHTKFKKTKFGDIPEEWSDLTMEDVCVVRQGLQIPISERFKEVGMNRYVYLTIKYLRDAHLPDIAEYIENPSKNVVCKEDDILMTRTGNTGKVITGVTGVFHNNFFLVDYDRNKIDKQFFVYYLNSDLIQKMIKVRAGSTTIPDLNHGDFYSLPLALPKKPEQQRIAETLLAIDEKILVNKILKAKFTLLKKGLMQDLLSGKVRTI